MSVRNVALQYCYSIMISAIAISGCIPKKRLSTPESSLNTDGGSPSYRIEEYTSDCLKALDISAENTPEFDCSDFVYNPRYGEVRTNRGWACMNPDGAGNAGCTMEVGTTTFLTLNNSLDLIAFVQMCSGIFPQIIAHRFETGDTCFFEDGKSLERPSGFRSPADYFNGDRTCVTCHSPYPFTNTPLIKSINLEKKLQLKDLESSIASLGQKGVKSGVKRILTAGLMEGKSPIELRELYDQGNAKILQINGTPSNVFRKEDNTWSELKYRVVQRDKLESLGKPGAWQFEYYNDAELKSCQSCHKLSAKHHSARTSAAVMGFCDLPGKEGRVCQGLDSSTLSIHKHSVPHNTLYRTEMRLSDKLKAGLTKFVNRCLGRSATGCVPEKDTSQELSELFEGRILRKVSLSCNFVESFFTSRRLAMQADKNELFDLGYLSSSEIQDLQVGILCSDKLKSGSAIPLKTKHFTEGSVSLGQDWCLVDYPEAPDVKQKLEKYAIIAEFEMKDFSGKCK